LSSIKAFAHGKKQNATKLLILSDWSHMPLMLAKFSHWRYANAISSLHILNKKVGGVSGSIAAAWRA
jgi:hypothetical protein